MSTSSTIRKQAKKEAREYTQAKLAYGEGAGVRRRLIGETVSYKIERVPGYEEAFDAELSKQDVADMAVHAKRDARRKAANEAITRNTKAVISGKYENVNTGILALTGLVVVLHKTGYDTKIINGTKNKYRDLRRRLRKTSMPKPSSRPTGDDKVHDITSMP